MHSGNSAVATQRRFNISGLLGLWQGGRSGEETKGAGETRSGEGDRERARGSGRESQGEPGERARGRMRKRGVAWGGRRRGPNTETKREKMERGSKRRA